MHWKRGDIQPIKIKRFVTVSTQIQHISQTDNDSFSHPVTRLVKSLHFYLWTSLFLRPKSTISKGVFCVTFVSRSMTCRRFKLSTCTLGRVGGKWWEHVAVTENFHFFLVGKTLKKSALFEREKSNVIIRWSVWKYCLSENPEVES